MLIESYRAKSEVVSSVLHHIDVFSIETDENTAYINYLHITNGCINQAFTFEYKVRMNESKEELLQLGIVEMRERYKSTSKEIIVPFELDMEMNGVTLTIPKKGEKKHLLDLSLMNVKQYKVDRLNQAEKLNPEQRSVRLMKEIQAQLQLEKMPNHIECFDNSNIQGADAVAACVVFKKAKPSKKDYRKYLIKTVVGPDDYASMQEVVRRRYSRILEEQGELPDLILTDGGKGQMEVVKQVIEDELHLQIPIVGLAKNNRHRTSEVLFGFPPQTLGIKQGTPLSIYWKISRMRCTALPSPSTGKKKQKPDCLCTRPYQRCRRQAENSPAENIQECGPHPASQLGRDCRSDWRKCSEKRQGITVGIQII